MICRRYILSLFSALLIGTSAGSSAAQTGKDDPTADSSNNESPLPMPSKSKATPPSTSKPAAVEQILELANGEGAGRGCEGVGYQCHDPAGHEVPNATMNDLVKSASPRTIGRSAQITNLLPQSVALKQKHTPTYEIHNTIQKHHPDACPLGTCCDHRLLWSRERCG